MKLTNEQIEQILAKSATCGFDSNSVIMRGLYEEILTLRRRVQKLKNLTQAVVDAWDCGVDDDLQRACGAIVDYTNEKGHE